jgi:diphthine-ammonia ligase
MRIAALFSGGKDSTYAAYLAKHDIVCLIAVYSKNPYSYMFHTPSITCVRKQAAVMKIPLIEQRTEGEKEAELKDLEKAIIKAKENYEIGGVVTGAVKSVYQASRIEKLCKGLGLEVINPLWQKDEIELLNELIKNKFEVIITGVAAYPLDESWLGRKIDKTFIEDVKQLYEKYKINPAGEGGEFETLVLNCPLFSRQLKIASKKISGSGNNFRMDVVLE